MTKEIPHLIKYIYLNSVLRTLYSPHPTFCIFTKTIAYKWPNPYSLIPNPYLIIVEKNDHDA